MAASRPPEGPRERDPSGAAPERMLGRVLGNRYRVLSRLGEGGMGTVYLCEHTVLQRRFALKVLRADLGGDPELAERFRNEAIAASRIGQENVVDVVDFGGEDEGALYYVMEALDGRSLGAILREEGPLPVERALALLEQVCRALGAAHARGVVHRDVKPENVFVVRRAGTSDEQVKVLDFGISHVPAAPGCERLTRAGAIIGTPEYMAPEQATGGAVDHRADVYAVGVLAFEMLTGALPIEAPTEIATLVAAQTQLADPPSRRNSAVPPEVDALVLRALAKRPEDRHPTMAAFAAEIARLRGALATASSLRHAIGTARSDGPLRPPGRPRGASRSRGGTLALTGAEVRSPAPRLRRTRTLAAVGAVAVLGVALAGGWWLMGEGRRGIPTATPTPTATATSTPPSPSTVSAPLDSADRARVQGSLAVTPAAELLPERAAPVPVRLRARARPAPGDVKDPYAAEGKDLKPDPFQ